MGGRGSEAGYASSNASIKLYNVSRRDVKEGGRAAGGGRPVMKEL